MKPHMKKFCKGGFNPIDYVNVDSAVVDDNNDKKDTSSPFGGLKQPKAGKRRVRGNSGGNAKDIDIFADLNDLALNPED